ncbi:MAG: ger1 [Micavibrio sp.]|nr:ger1 [Micavibrio sp.]
MPEGIRQPTALITGITGQDGSLLARFLLGRGYAVHGLRCYSATDDLERLPDDILSHESFHFITGDLTDGGNLIRVLGNIRPDEIYNLGAQSHVGASFEIPEATANINGLGTLRLLEAVRALNLPARFYQASSSEMFGNAPAPQTEETPFAPCSPYAAAKLYAYWMVRTYRQSYGIHASNGILFNHESPVRGVDFVTRKIARAVARGEPLVLGNLDARRDWGHARDYVEGMWLMLQQKNPGDYVLATGQAHSVRDFVEAAYRHTGTSIFWTGTGTAEKGMCVKTKRILVTVDKKLFRPAEVNHLRGDAGKAKRILGWMPRTTFPQLVAEMVDAERNGGMHVLLRNKRIWVAGETGMVGRAVLRQLEDNGCTVLSAPHDTLDLRNQDAAATWIAAAKPDVIILAAATVGGIEANRTRPGEFLYDNMMIAANVIHAAAQAKVEKLLYLGSSCIYPRDAAQPMREDALLTGGLEPSNEAYAIAKIAGLKLCQYYRQQYGCDFMAAMPCNLYGPGDKFDPMQSHVIPAMILKISAATEWKMPDVTLWGTGAPRREFLHVDDLARALVMILQYYKGAAPLNIGSGEEITIAGLASIIGGHFNYGGRIVFDAAYPDGTPRKVLDSTGIRALGWKPRIALKDGLRATIGDYNIRTAAPDAA